MLRVFALAVALAGSGGCASYAPVYNGEFIQLELSEVEDYWINENKTVRFSVPAEDRKYLGVDGETSGNFTIDSNGVVTDVTVVGSIPPGAYVKSTERQFQERRYRPGPKNPEARPARVAFTVTFDGGGSKDEKRTTR